MGKIGEQAGGPVEAGAAQEAGGESGGAMLGQGRVDARLGSGVGGAAQRQCDRPQPQFEQPIAACGLKVILPLRRRVTDQLDLPIVQPEPLIRGTALRLDRAIVGQQYARSGEQTSELQSLMRNTY